ncbi:MAG TPA: serpin family protein [Pyrinomonadaceae bacterium]|nr:serpin family protein [Pyrinomonadaceae bacterium]
MKAFLASVIALILCAGLAVTRSRSESKGLQKPVDSRLTAATTRFSFKLYKQIREPRSQNTFVSPASVMLALAMTYNGADGTTREAMAKTLEVDGMSLDEVNRAFGDLKSALTPNDPKVQLTIANSLWARNGFTMKPAFIERNKQHYGAEVTNLDFGSPAATDTINSWVKKNTGGKIEKIVDQIRDGEVLFLINAIYFKGQWSVEFKKENTKPDAFRLAGGEQKQLPMMSQSGSYLYYKGDNFQSVALPYGKGDVNMYIFLPDEQTSLDRFEQDLTPENWDRWMNSFGFGPGEIKLPRFKVEWEATLNDALTALGMAEAFDGGRANFSQIAPVTPGNRLYITEVKHKSWCEVNEEGTVAAAATSVGMALTSAPPPPFSMKVDRPFFFAIRDRVSGVVLFMGSVTNPG